MNTTHDYHPDFPDIEPIVREWLHEEGRKAFLNGKTTVDHIRERSYTLDNAAAHVMHEGWCEARNEWWFGPRGPLAFN